MCAVAILVVEDDATIRSLVTVSLKREHFNVISASNADEALQLIEKNERIDLLLTDVQMEGSMSGIELADVVHIERPGLPVLVMSGYPHALAVAAEKGYPTLAKPFTLTMLGDRVRTVLATRVSPGLGN